MPLDKSGSRKAFDRNVETEIAAGKNPRQAVAIGYSIKRNHSPDSYDDSSVIGETPEVHEFHPGQENMNRAAVDAVSFPQTGPKGTRWSASDAGATKRKSQ